MTALKNGELLPSESKGNYEATRFNALKHALLSRYTILPWESQDEYRVVLEALVAEHDPKGPTEEHCIKELAGVIWRKRRLRLGEAAAYNRGLLSATEPYRDTAQAALDHMSA
jgi:hypothetical protein